MEAILNSGQANKYTMEITGSDCIVTLKPSGEIKLFIGKNEDDATDLRETDSTTGMHDVLGSKHRQILIFLR